MKNSEQDKLKPKTPKELRNEKSMTNWARLIIEEKNYRKKTQSTQKNT